jgi:hypothetical protein
LKDHAILKVLRDGFAHQEDSDREMNANLTQINSTLGGVNTTMGEINTTMGRVVQTIEGLKVAILQLIQKFVFFLLWCDSI